MDHPPRKIYTLSQLGLVPGKPVCSSREVDISWTVDAFRCDLPFLAYPSDAVVDPDFAIAMHQLGGLAVLDAEGLLSRYRDYKPVLNSVKEAGWAASPRTKRLQELYQAPIDHGLLVERIAQVRDAGATVAVRVSPGRVRELAPVVIGAGADILVLHADFLSAEHEGVRLEELIRDIEVPIFAGGVMDYATALEVMRAGVAGVIVGDGHTLAHNVLGIEDEFSATAIVDVAAARRDYLDESGGRYVHVIANISGHSTGQVIKAVACGADAVMLGRCLAMTDEAAADKSWWQEVAAHPTLPHDFVENFYASLPLEEMLVGPSVAGRGLSNFAGSLRQAIAVCGFRDIKSFHKVELTVTIR